MIEKIFESGLWSTRFITIFAVIFGVIGSIILFIVASVDIFHVSVLAYQYFILGTEVKEFHVVVVSEIIGAVDLYLIGVVLLIFGFGIYELFISNIDAAREKGRILSITSLDQLKDKIAKVIVMVLVVNFFQRILHTTYNGPQEMLYFAGSIMGISIGLYFLGKVGKH
ncbi:YqhA family protein [Sulfurospirillum sp. 1612]|uniref:YqhA family protein n=1 Tax=Sulfurospirillum sp. 1612 TaxID=3094835 RepID=UPI002F9381EC